MSAFSDRLNAAFGRPRIVRSRAELDMQKGQEIEDRYGPAIQDWMEEHRCVFGDFRGDQHSRFRLWQSLRAIDGDPAQVIAVWFERTHRHFARFLYAGGLIGSGDTDADTRAEIAGLDAVAEERRGGF